ncbi:MAG TPA: ABC-F family ATP-binding cassette domain-containing protein [bacterium]|nr:ABC-F family ATP-binding cassette domain-containing protein [bacterium]
MIKIQNLHKQYGAQVLFDDASLQMGPGERLGLVGRNGHGKSTLLRIILGEDEADEGSVVLPRGYRLGHLAQHIRFSRPTVLEEGCLGLPEGEEHDSYKVERILFGLGFTKEDMDRPPEEFSGGYQVRLNLAKVLVSHPNLLLLDEPTNYLDIVSIRWITKFLRAWEGEMILISHDREFMDSVTTHTAAIHRQKIKKVQGGTEKLYAQIAQEEEIHEKTRVNEEKRRQQIEAFVTRFKAKASKAAAAQSRVKMLEKMPSREVLARIADLDFEFRYAPFEAKTILEAQGLSFGFDEELFHDLNLTIGAKDRIAVIGKNGKGKSTLLNVLAGEFAPKSGSIRTHPNMKLGYFGQTNIDRLHPKLTVEEEIGNANLELSRTSVRGICGIMMFSGEAAEKRVSVLSGGEKSRVLLGKILASPANLLFLDEPTNHLDMQSIEALVDAIDLFEGAVVIVTHSEMILREVATKLVVFQHGDAEVFNGTYAEFLDKIGWEEESTDGRGTARRAPTAAPPIPQEPVNKKESRKKRADVIAEKSRILTPLKKEMETLEADICRLESEQAAVNQELAAASEGKNIDAFVRLSKKMKEIQDEIEEKFGRLETATKKHDEKSRKYEALLEEAP